MPRRGSEPDEAIGPVLDGFAALPEYEDAPVPDIFQVNEIAAPEEELLPVAVPAQGEDIAHPVALICGYNEDAAAMASLAADCGFEVELAINAETAEVDCPAATQIHCVPDYDNLVGICGIERNYFVCIFEDDMLECEVLLSQALASDACYLGLSAGAQKKDEIFAALRADGAPDAELAAVCCPMGLNIRPKNSVEKAVGIVAELLAARGVTLKRLRHEPRPGKA